MARRDRPSHEDRIHAERGDHPSVHGLLAVDIANDSHRRVSMARSTVARSPRATRPSGLLLQMHQNRKYYEISDMFMTHLCYQYLSNMRVYIVALI